jgi:succinate---hydroxymethylglutarate CoA-transferase
MHITGDKEGSPCKVGVAVTDIATGLYAHGAIMAALISRQQTGKGVHIDCNLFDTQVWISPTIIRNTEPPRSHASQT